jgi:hypothetical protein
LLLGAAESQVRHLEQRRSLPGEEAETMLSELVARKRSGWQQPCWP